MKSEVKTKGSNWADIPLIERKITFGDYRGRYIYEVPVEFFEALLLQEDNKPSFVVWLNDCIDALKRYDKKQKAKREVAFYEFGYVPQPPPVKYTPMRVAKKKKARFRHIY